MFNQVLGFFSNDNKYKVSDIVFYDEHNNITISGDDPFMCALMFSLKPGGFYTRKQLHEELQSLKRTGMFEKVDLEYTAKPDRSLLVTFLFTENKWPLPEYFRCINVGLTPQVKAYSEARPCLLPASINLEVLGMMDEEGNDEVSGRLLHKIKERVEKWYHDEGYICAQVVNFTELNTKEVVCEVTEGHITKLDLIEGNNDTIISEIPNEWKKLCDKVKVGHVYSTKAGKQVLRNLMSLGLFENIDLGFRCDEMNEGGVVIEIKVWSKKSNTSQNWPINILKSSIPTLFM